MLLKITRQPGMKFILNFWLLLSILVQKGFSQEYLGPYNSIVVAVICHDGVLMAADSRTSFIKIADSSKKTQSDSRIVYACYDSARKIFSLGNCIVGVAGDAIAGKYFYGNLINDFRKSYRITGGITTTFNAFLGYLENRFKTDRSSILAGTQFILAGYEKGNPVIYGYSSRGVITEKRLGGAIESDQNFIPYLAKPDNVPTNCPEVAPFLELGIKAFAKDQGNNMTGGPFQLIQIAPGNKIVTLKDFEPINFGTYNAMALAILHGQLHVNYIYSWSESLLAENLRRGMKME
jgi:20S proteasome alpha/beta subunit